MGIFVLQFLGCNFLVEFLIIFLYGISFCWHIFYALSLSLSLSLSVFVVYFFLYDTSFCGAFIGFLGFLEFGWIFL